ncbi:MAG: FdhF/YdeP family oxidoreductase [Chloroflexaceae bacterium]
MAHTRRGWDPSLWVSLKPFGIGEQRPNNYLEIWKALVENRDQLPYAWRILSQGVCDGCALGTAGLSDWTLSGVHLCNIRLRLLRLNTMPPFAPSLLADVGTLTGASGGDLRALGRLPCPLVRRRGEAGFQPLSWDAALDLVAAHIRSSAPERLGFYLTSRGMPNESYYMAQKAVRAMGTNSIDNAARLCHAPSTVALKGSLGVGATTCSYSDWLETDLIVFIGSNVANNQPVATKYLYHARRNGTRIVCVNSYREPGMERYWIPSIGDSALFGTKLAETFFLINTGGDVAFFNGVLKHIFAEEWHDADFVRRCTSGFTDLRACLDEQRWDDLEAEAGASRAEMRQMAELVRDARRAVFVWSMGVTQHAHGEDGVRAILNLALSKGFVGRPGCGVMPIRGHSGVQGGAEMGAYATVFPGGEPITEAAAERLEALWGFRPPTRPGMTTPEMLAAASRGELDVLFAAGGNFVEVMPDPEHTRAALERIPLRVHMDIVLSSQMLIEPADTVLLLPATTRYEIPGGVTETSTERRVIFSPEIPGPRVPQARCEAEVFADLAARVRPDLAHRLRYRGMAAIRKEIARVIPFYDGIQHLRRQGDQFQYGGPHLCAGWRFPTPDGKARFTPVTPPRTVVPEGMFRLSTRRGKQFNTIVHEQRDALNGAIRDAVLMNAADAARLGLRDGDAVRLMNERGEYRGRVLLAPLRPGNLQVHWPEANHLLSRDTCSPEAHIPDYNALVRVERA